MRAGPIESVARPVLIDRVVYTTIAIACVLIVYDGWSQLSRREVAAVIVGPVLAMCVGHVFSGGLALQVSLGRPLSWSERRTLIVTESRFLLMAVPPLVILGVLDLAGVALTDAVRVIVVLEALSLGFWAGLAAQRAGLRRWAIARAVVSGLAIGGIVLLLRVILQPGSESLANDASGFIAILGRT